MPIPAAVIAAGISAAGAGGSSIIGNAGSKRAAKYAAKKNLEFWHMQNAYNDPSAQMERLRAAGLNPNLIYGSGTGQASGNAESIAPFKPAEYKMENPLSQIQQFADYGVKQAQANNLGAQSNNVAQDTALKAAQTADTIIKSKSNSVTAKLAEATYFNSLEASNEALRQQKANTLSAELDSRFKDTTFKNRVEEIGTRVQIAKATLRGENLKNDLLRYEKELNQLGITKGDPIFFRILGKVSDNVKTFGDKLDKNMKWLVDEKIKPLFKN